VTNRIDRAFDRLRSANEGALVAFITAGDPTIEGTPQLIADLAEAGADIVELGVPYSDPLADGPVIQDSTQRALDRGTTPDTVFKLVKQARELTDVPIVLMTAYNIALKYGLDRYAKTCAEYGADGCILTDLPPEGSADWKDAADASGIATVFLVAPTSTPERIALITKYSTGFIYCVSRTGVTGARQELPTELRELVSTIRSGTDKPVCVGFGVSSAEHVKQVVDLADGAVIGSALVTFLNKYKDSPNLSQEVKALVADWKKGTVRG
jgi:tryptophan synthase alpha chain